MKLEAMLPRLIEHRRALHRIPELGYEEHKTQKYLLSVLETLGMDRLECIQTGIKAVLLVPGATRTLAFRADMDALAVQEDTQAEHQSTHPGQMHACGHDGHMAILLGLCELASKNRDRLRNNLVFLFQPAEESEGGAPLLIREGALADPPVDEIYGLHILPDLPMGTVGVREGAVMAQNSEFDIMLTGKGSHGAMPHQGRDAILAAAALIQSLHTQVLRGVDPLQSAVITVGRMQAGSVRNVIAEHALLECTVRTFDESVYAGIMSRVQHQLAALEEGFGVTGRLVERVYYPPVVNAAQPTERVHAAAGERAVSFKPLLISEDFSFYQQQVPGCYFFIGSGTQRYSQPLHAAQFDFDERILLTGLEVNWALATQGA